MYKSAFLLVFMMMILVFSGCSDEPASADAAILSNNSILANLVVTPVNITSFSVGSTYYPLTVANAVTSVGFTPTTNEGHQNVTINGVTAISGVETTVAVSVGNTNIDIVVTAEDNSRTVYRVAVTRSAIIASSDCTLANLAVLPTDISNFSSGNNYYEITVENSVASIGIIPTTNEGHQNISIAGAEASSGVKTSVVLNVGTNNIAVIVTAEDASTATYTVAVIREALVMGSVTNLLITEWADAGTDIDYIEIRNFGSNFVEIATNFAIHFGSSDDSFLIYWGAGNNYSNYQILTDSVTIAPGELFLVVDSDLFNATDGFTENANVNFYLNNGMPVGTKIFISDQSTLIGSGDSLDENRAWLAVGALTWSYTPEPTSFATNVGTSTYSVLTNGFNLGIDNMTNTDMWFNGTATSTWARSPGSF